MKPYAIALVLVSMFLGWASPAGSPNGRAGAVPAYYDDELFTINLKELDDTAAQSLLAHNSSVNFIFMYEDLLPDGNPFVAVIDAVPGDEFNPIWVELEIEFTPGHTPRQFTGDEDIAAAVVSGEITLEASGEVYRCSVIGPK